MPTPHINAQKGDFAKVVLMPGDPLRAKWISETYLHDVKLVTTVRNAFGYTGYTKNNIRVSVMASGMGIPSIGIYSHELFSEYDVDAIIRIGTCGTYDKDIKLGDVMLATCASTDSNWSYQFNLPGVLSAGGDFDMIVKAAEVLAKKDYAYKAGNILSADVFYDYDKDIWKRWAAMGIIGVEMETYGLYTKAAQLKKRALGFFTATDHFVTGERLSSEERQMGLKKMVEVALEVAEHFAK